MYKRIICLKDFQQNVCKYRQVIEFINVLAWPMLQSLLVWRVYDLYPFFSKSGFRDGALARHISRTFGFRQRMEIILISFES